MFFGLIGLLAGLAILPVVIVGFFIFAVFFAAPFCYFLTRPNIFGAKKKLMKNIEKRQFI